jgi:hypothetical protein
MKARRRHQRQVKSNSKLAWLVLELRRLGLLGLDRKNRHQPQSRLLGIANSTLNCQ